MISVRQAVDGKEWDDLAGTCTRPTAYHFWSWLKIIEESTGAQLHPLIAGKGDNATMLLPVFKIRKKGLNFLFSPPPKTGLPYLGPLEIMLNPDMKDSTRESQYLASIDALTQHIRENISPNYQLIATTPGSVDARPFTWNGYIAEPLYTYILDLSGGEDEVFMGFQKQARTDIKKTIKEGVEIRQGGLDEIRLIHDAAQARFRQQGLETNVKLQYLEKLFEKMHSDRLRVFTAYHEGEFEGGFISIIHPDRASYWFGGSKSEKKGIYPNDLLQWEAMKWAINKGIKKYEIVGAVDPRLRHFKSKFNPQLVLWHACEKYNPKILEQIEKIARKTYAITGKRGLV